MIGSTIKSGTNEFHGIGLRVLARQQPGRELLGQQPRRPAAKKAELSQNIFGATLGGPIIKNKLFFFADYQGFIRNRPGELVRSVAPRPAGEGDLSGAGVTITDPITGPALPG